MIFHDKKRNIGRSNWGKGSCLGFGGCSWALVGMFLLGGALGLRGGELRVVGTVGMVTDVLGEVAGDRVEVEGLLGSGVDPHIYQVSRGDVVKLGAADGIVYNGLQLEGRMGPLLERMSGRGVKVLGVAEAALERAGRVALGGGEDPHVWMDASLWAEAARAMAEFLGELDEAGAGYYAERAERYAEKLGRLHRYGEAVLSSVPAGRRILVTAHDAFGYFGAAYGLEVRGIQGMSTESEAGLRDVEELVALVVEREIPVVFVEDTVSEKNVRALVEGARSRGWDLRVGGTLYSDAMGPEGTYTGTYIGMLDHNLSTIARALGGDVPAGGFQGKLDLGE